MTTLRCDVRRAGGHACRGLLTPRTDAIGRVHFDCPACTRRRAGICADCPRPVAGTVGKAERCASCKRAALRQADRTWRLRDPDHTRALHREVSARIRHRQRQGAPPMTRQESGHIAGLARAAKLSPTRRSAIARHAVETRWARHRAAQAATAA